MLRWQEIAKFPQEIALLPVDTSRLPVGRVLKVERVAAGVPLGLVASAVGISAGHLSRIESGERTGSPELIERIRIAVRAAAA